MLNCNVNLPLLPLFIVKKLNKRSESQDRRDRAVKLNAINGLNFSRDQEMCMCSTQKYKLTFCYSYSLESNGVPELLVARLGYTNEWKNISLSYAGLSPNDAKHFGKL